MNRVSHQIAVFIYLFCVPYVTMAQSQRYNYPGGIINLEISKESTRLPEVKFGIRDATLIDNKNSWRILVGIDLETVPGEYLIYIKRQSEDSTPYSSKFEVIQQDTLILDLENDSQPASLHHDNFTDISFNNTVHPELPLAFPAQGMWADYFGYISASSQQKKLDTRNYISLTTTEIMTVTAPQHGIITRIIENESDDKQSTKKNFTLFLDHGRGLYSVISGVTDITIDVGNGVQAGAILGKVYSKSNDSSEPRTLIWQTVLNGAYVNPTILTKF
ncbi:MAG: peptidoglycan DD-metalloendopeptidase family protein [Acidiferrobacterales bacterium]|nr:peptidoglycan DD-metalloendopeptidase family protein [Acidiferrobacterales bacterium]